MKTYSDSCKKNTANENSNVRKTKQKRLMLLLNCAVFGKTKNKNQLLLKIKNSAILIIFKMINLNQKRLTNFSWLEKNIDIAYG